MKTTIKVISLSVILTGLIFAAQEPPRPAGSGLAERFKQLDKNGDGKVTREEAAQLPMFDQWDANKDGVATLPARTGFTGAAKSAARASASRAKAGRRPSCSPCTAARRAPASHRI